MAIKKSSGNGGASFIGSHLVEALVRQDARVRVADNFSSGRIENLEKVRKDIDILEGDLRDLAFAKKAVANSQLVFHLAASHGGRGYIDTHPVECSTNMILDGNVFMAAHTAGVERICFASSACVYQTNLQTKPTEGSLVYLKEEWTDPLRGEGVAADGEYGFAKLMGEMTLHAYHKQYKLAGSLCRIFTAYGERENETHAVIALIAKVLIKMDPYIIWGDGEQDRNFTYVGDTVIGMQKAMENITDCSPVNIGTAEHIKVIDAVNMIFEYTGFHPKKIQFDTAKPVGVFSRAADLTRSRSLLHWEPQTAFRDGLVRTIDWYYRTHDRNRVQENIEKLLTER